LIGEFNSRLGIRSVERGISSIAILYLMHTANGDLQQRP